MSGSHASESRGEEKRIQAEKLSKDTHARNIMNWRENIVGYNLSVKLETRGGH